MIYPYLQKLSKDEEMLTSAYQSEFIKLNFVAKIEGNMQIFSIITSNVFESRNMQNTPF